MRKLPLTVYTRRVTGRALSARCEEAAPNSGHKQVGDLMQPGVKKPSLGLVGYTSHQLPNIGTCN